MEAKKRGEWSPGVAPCLACMGEFGIIYVLLLKSNLFEGMLHRTREKQHRQDYTVYGMSAVWSRFLLLEDQQLRGEYLIMGLWVGRLALVLT